MIEHRTPALTLIMLLAGTSALGAQTELRDPPVLELEIEGGPSWQSSNDVEIPNDGSASRFSLSDLAGAGPRPAGRVYVTWNVNERHGLRLLVAPLSVTDVGTPDRPLVFAGSDYLASQPVTATYTFNSYRISYRWRGVETPSFRGWLGFTAKIRDATVALAQGTTTSRKDDLGFVPLLHLAGEFRLADRWHASVDADGLAGGPGRAIDAALKVGVDLNPGWSVLAGYRTVEGGADVDEVYNFAWLHYATLSVRWAPF